MLIILMLHLRGKRLALGFWFMLEVGIFTPSQFTDYSICPGGGWLRAVWNLQEERRG